MTTVGYIGGLGRSGSTLLERIAGRLDGVCVLGEVVHLWERAIQYDELCSCGEPFSRCPFWTPVGEIGFGGWANVDVERLRHLASTVDRTRFIPSAVRARDGSARAADMREYADAFATVYAAAAEVAGASVVVDSSKHPSTAFVLRRVPGLDLRVIHLVRDSRGVAYSWTKHVARPEANADSAQAEMFRYPPWKAAALWDTHNVAFGALGRLGVPVWRLHYERLLAEPVGTVRDLARYLGVGDQDVESFVSPERVVVGPAHQIAGNYMRFTSGDLPLRRDEAWRDQLPDPDRRLVTALTAPLMAGYGYFGAGPRPTVRPPARDRS